MEININPKPSCVIKSYPVEIVIGNSYNLIIIHNETTGEIELTAGGISSVTYSRCVEDVIHKFKREMGLNRNGKKKRKQKVSKK